MSHNVVLLPGDGVGPEVIAATRHVLDAAAKKFGIAFNFSSYDVGGAAIDACGDPLPEDTLAACLSSDAIFLGAIGGPKWDQGAVRPEAGLLSLRKKLGVFANLRPLIMFNALAEFSPLRDHLIDGADILIVRELTGGVYFGEREEGEERASDLCTYTRPEVDRIAKVAFEAAKERKGKVTSVDKANVMATSRLWRNAVSELHAAHYSDIELHHQLVDSMAMKLITGPAEFDVVVTENMFGDILSDEASVIAGSIGLLPSASLGADGPGLYEPIHGSAPDIAGKNIANPVGSILSGAMLLRHSLGLDDAAIAIEKAVEEALNSGLRTADLGGSTGTMEAADAIAAKL